VYARASAGYGPDLPAKTSFRAPRLRSYGAKQCYRAVVLRVGASRRMGRDNFDVADVPEGRTELEAVLEECAAERRRVSMDWVDSVGAAAQGLCTCCRAASLLGRDDLEGATAALGRSAERQEVDAACLA